MEHFSYKDGQLWCDGVPVTALAQKFGTPLYVYSEAAIRENARRLRDAFAEVKPLICYAVKANYNLAVCRVLHEEGCGFDIVSGGELFRVLKVGADPEKVVYAGVGKTRAEIDYALRSGILLFNVESGPELDRIAAAAAALGVEARVALRLNPDVDAHTHRHTRTGTRGTKFGLDFDTAAELCRRTRGMSGVRLVGFHFHLGSPINSPEPYRRALERVLGFVESSRRGGVDVKWLDVGGGYGIEYKGGETAMPEDYAAAIVPYIKNSGCRAILEPGRYCVGEAAILVTRVQYVKKTGSKTFVICDAGMNDLIRPSLYDSYHRIWPVNCTEPAPYGAAALEAPSAGRVRVDVVGPVCETGDYFARDRLLPPVSEGDLLAVFAAGAYGASMSSNYNSRPRACEVMVWNGSPRVIRERESYESITANEAF